MKTYNLICKIVEFVSTNSVHTKEKEYVVPCNGEKIFMPYNYIYEKIYTPSAKD